ncbi:MAG: hypothetical protein QOI64_1580 [Solirubrobacteraceae bacterium]|nr:hypothetical protein [Solirubrobacteraceae bacterium]
MQRAAADREAQRRNARLGPAGRRRWFVRAAGTDDWTLVLVAGLPANVLGPLKTTTEAKPRPPMADDPRPSFERNVGGGWWVG